MPACVYTLQFSNVTKQGGSVCPDCDKIMRGPQWKLFVDCFRCPHISAVKSKQHNTWIRPEGYDTGIRIFNPMTRCKEPLIFRNRHQVTWYMCGPTVYDTSHLGHASSYVRLDLIRRILENYFGIRPIVALGITDIDDKIIARANALDVDFKIISKQYEIEFFKNLKQLNVQLPTFITRVTDHIPHIIDFVKTIVEKGDAYPVQDGSVYFTTKENNYGKLIPMLPKDTSMAVLNIGQQKALDFALWKGQKPNEPSWESPWGHGRPGWHIECSAMASKLFGKQLDIHSGGIDLIFPHHENEEAQSCSYHECQQWVNYWIHCGHLLLENEKMSKSLGNVVPISASLEKYSADCIRMFCLMTHYRKNLDYNTTTLDTCKILCDKFSNFFVDVDSYIKGTWSIGVVSEAELLQTLEEVSETVRSKLADDFDTPPCIASVRGLMLKISKMINDDGGGATSSRGVTAVAAGASFLKTFFESLGFRLATADLVTGSQSQAELEYIIDKSVSFRRQIRETAFSINDKPAKQNLFKASDVFRNDLKAAGVLIKDQSKTGSSWSFATGAENSTSN